MTIFYTSDLHLNHHNIIEYCDRPYSSVEVMNEALLGNWNSVVKKNDTIYIIGDLILGQFDKGLEITKQLNGIKYLIPGNHDKHLFYKSKSKYASKNKIKEYNQAIIDKYYNDGEITLCPPIIYKTINDINCMLCHFPATTSSKSRYVEYAPKLTKDISILLCGHVHEKWKVNDNQINVGVDVWNYTPVPEEEIYILIKEVLK